MDSTLFLVVIQFLVLLLSLSLHESAHAWTADRLGDPTARYLGRVSLNPVVHADLFGTVIFPLVGLFGLMGGLMFGWAKPVPVNVNALRNPKRDHMLVAAAGPVSNLMLAAVMFSVLFVIKLAEPDLVRQIAFAPSYVPKSYSAILTPLALFAYHGMITNVLLAIFNLIPVAPLDGAAVLSGLLPRPLAAIVNHIQGFGIMILIILLVSGVPSLFFNPAIRFVKSFFLYS